MENNNAIHMDQKIFTKGLSVNTVSVYLSCCGLADTNTELSRDNISEVWNETPELLDQGLNELIDLNILTQSGEEMSEGRIYILNKSDIWN